MTLTSEVLLSEETIRLFNSLGIKSEHSKRIELVGCLMTRTPLPDKTVAVAMRVLRVLMDGVVYATLDDLVQLTLIDVSVIKALGVGILDNDLEVRKTISPVLTSGIGILPNEEVTILRSNNGLALAHDSMEVRISPQDVDAILLHSVRKDDYSIIAPKNGIWKVSGVKTYSLTDLLRTADIPEHALIVAGAVPSGSYSTSALLNIHGTVYDNMGIPSGALDMFRHIYNYAELRTKYDAENPYFLLWVQMTEALTYGTPEFVNFLVYNTSRYRGLFHPIQVDDGKVFTINGYLTPKQYFMQFDKETDYAHESKCG